MPHEEQEAPIGVQNDLMDAPSPYYQQNRHILHPLDSIHPHIDCIGKYITHMETKRCASLAHIGKCFLCICSRSIYAYGIVLSCGKKIRNVGNPMDSLGT